MQLSGIKDLAPVLAEKLERDGISWRDAPYIHEDVRRMLEEEYWNSRPVDNAIIDLDDRFITLDQAAWLESLINEQRYRLQTQITARQKEDMQMRLTAEMVNAAVFTPRELQTTRLWTMVPDDAENVLYADNVPVVWEGGKVE